MGARRQQREGKSRLRARGTFHDRRGHKGPGRGELGIAVSMAGDFLPPDEAVFWKGSRQPCSSCWAGRC